MKAYANEHQSGGTHAGFPSHFDAHRRIQQPLHAFHGVGTPLLGLWVQPVRWLYDYAWFVGFGVSGAVYFAFMRGQVGTRGAVMTAASPR